jgi:hypothetical protein
MTTEYAEGFITKCAEQVVDPEQLLKSAGKYNWLNRVIGAIERKGSDQARHSLADKLSIYPGTAHADDQVPRLLDKTLSGKGIGKRPPLYGDITERDLLRYLREDLKATGAMDDFNNYNPF